ncbi:MAG: hypothetical protein ACI4LO_06405 [Anaerovoracaceae bacterium]
MAIDFAAEKAKRKKQNKKQAENWNKNNSAKVNTNGTVKTSSTATKVVSYKPTTTKHTAGKSNTNAAKGHKTLSQTGSKTKSNYYKAWEDNATSRAILGGVAGVVSSVTGAEVKNEKLKKSKAFTAGNVAGQMASYGLGYSGVSKAAGKAAAKAVTSKTGKKIISKAAKSKVFKTAAKKTLTSAGKKATAEAVSKTAKKQAQKVIKGAVKGAVADATVGTVLNTQSARSQGYKGKELAKEVAKQGAIDFATGGIIEAAPTVSKALKGSKKVKVNRLSDGQIKSVKVAEKDLKPNIDKISADAKVKSKASVKEFKKSQPKKYKVPQAKSAKKEIQNVKINKNLTARERQIDSLYQKELEKNAEAIRNYKGQGTSANFTPDRDRLDAGWEASSGFGYTTRSSNNAKWYQDFYKENGRAPNKSEAVEIAQKHLDDDIWAYVNGSKSAGDMELGASDELKKLAKEYEDMKSGENMRISKKTLSEINSKADAKEFFSYVSKKYGQGEDLLRSVNADGGNFDDFLTKKYDEFSALRKDLGADVYKESTTAKNIEKYGEMDGVPKGTPYGETSQGAKTIYNSDMLDSTAKQKVMIKTNQGDFAKYSKSNKTALDNAGARVESDLDTAYNDFKSFERNNVNPTSETIALGYKLAEKYQSAGDYTKMMDVLSDVVSMESEAGRTLQAMRIFSNLSPEGRVKSVVRNVNKLSAKANIEIKIPDELMETLYKASTESEQNAAQKAIMVNVWNQIPATWTEKANAWRYLSMLGNPKTHIRNVLGNALFVPVKGLRNVIASGLEKKLIKTGERSKAILTKADKDLIDLGKTDFASVKDSLTGSSRYFEGGRDLDSKVFRNKALEKARTFNSYLLEKEDEIFMEYAYKRAYAQYLKANGHTAGSISAEVADKARKYAVDEALNSTYRDASWLADSLAKAKKNASLPTDMIQGKTYGEKVGKKIMSTALEATIPFSKTPINIMRRGADYSPIGLVRGMAKLMKAGGDNEALRNAISDLSSGLTGTGILTIGGYMGYKGYAQGSLDTSTTEGKYANQLGEQEYSIRIGDHTYTMDWAAPLSMPFFVGAEIGNLLSGEAEIKSVLNAFTKITDPIFNLSMLSGLNTALDVGFGDNSVIETVKNMGESYISQYLPTIGSQIAKTISPTQKTTTSTNPNSDIAGYESYLNSLKNKVPGLNLTNADYVDLWGNRNEKNTAADYAKAVVENFISPGTLKSTAKSSVDRELYNVGQKVGMNEIAPKSTKKSEYQKVFDGKTYNMTEKEASEYKQNKGKYAERELKKLFATSEYKNMSADDKRKAINKVYDAAKDDATSKYLMSKGVSKEDIIVSKMSESTKKAYEESGMSVDKFTKLNNAKKKVSSSDGSVTKAMKMINSGASSYKEVKAMYGTTSERAYNNAVSLTNLGISTSQLNKVADKADANGNGYYTTDELVTYLNSTNYSTLEKRYLFATLANWNAKNPY